jgi:hypothetical protein
MISKQFLIFLGVGLVVIGGALFLVFSTTKGNHLELKGDVLKIRTGALDEKNSAAVLDVRLTNPSDVPFVVREVSVTVDGQDGQSTNGSVVSKTDLKQLFAYNRFLGDQYNEGLGIKDSIAPHATVDRMVAVQFEIPAAQLDNSKVLHFEVQDLDGALFDATRKMK